MQYSGIEIGIYLLESNVHYIIQREELQKQLCIYSTQRRRAYMWLSTVVHNCTYMHEYNGYKCCEMDGNSTIMLQYSYTYIPYTYAIVHCMMPLDLG